MKAFKNHNGRGFFLTFPNGVRLSTQFGWANYCENYDFNLPVEVEMKKTDWESNDAEIAIFSPSGEWITKQFDDSEDDVLGHVSMTKWLKALDFCRKWKPSCKAAGKES